jgi:DNA polymerase-4
MTFDTDLTDEREMRIVLRTLARKVFRRAARHGVVGKTANLKVKFSDFKTVTRSAGSDNVISSGEDLGELAVTLLRRTDAGKNPVRLLGVGLSSLQSSDLPQTEQLKLPLPEF